MIQEALYFLGARFRLTASDPALDPARESNFESHFESHFVVTFIADI